MAKIHTHYDNLKVARLAPQEVIRAAYKALSQKYHPDKNPGDAKAARIMAILNSAYGTLSDPQRRKEHDEWIAAEEWEIEWLESTHQEENRGKGRADAPAQAWTEEAEVEAGPARRWPRDWKWWGSLAGCAALGWLGAWLVHSQPELVPDALTAVWGGRPSHAAEASSSSGRSAREARAEAKAESKAEVAADAWAVSKGGGEAAAKAPIQVAAVAQVVLPASAMECDSAAPNLVAPNGEPWPVQSGYVEGFPISNKGDDLQLTIDNARNNFSVFVKLYDQDRRSNVRYIYLLPHDRLLVDRLGLGRYEVRYQRIEGGEGCAAGKKGSPGPGVF